MKRKYLSIIMACGLVLGLAGGSSATVAAADKSEDKETVDAKDVSNAEGEQVTLEFINGSSEEQYVAWLDEIIANFEEANPNVKVEVQRVSIDSFNQTVMTRFAAGDVPDLFTFSEKPGPCHQPPFFQKRLLPPPTTQGTRTPRLSHGGG